MQFTLNTSTVRADHFDDDLAALIDRAPSAALWSSLWDAVQLYTEAEILAGVEITVDDCHGPAPAPADLIAHARNLYASHRIQIDDDATACPTEDGTGGNWVQAWIWVPGADQ